jgi:hypothetical protein
MDVADVVGDTSLELSMSFVEFEPTTRKSEGRGKKKIDWTDTKVTPVELAAYEADQAYYESMIVQNEGTPGVGPQDPADFVEAGILAGLVADDDAAYAAHLAEVGKEDPRCDAFRSGKSNAMGPGVNAGKL